jgi:MoxR-like ATPase
MSEHRTVTAVGARKAILKCFAKKRPAFLWGPPGIGKSEVVSGIVEELGGMMYDVRLGQMDPTDIRGIPFYNKDTGKMDWAPPIDLPDAETCAEYPVVVLFMDEMNTAAPAVQAAAYQLILNRRIGKYQLPDNVVMIAAGNRESDKGVTYRMPTPLANRFVHIEMRPDFATWQDNIGTKGSLEAYELPDSTQVFEISGSISFDTKEIKEKFSNLRDAIANYNQNGD